MTTRFAVLLLVVVAAVVAAVGANEIGYDISETFSAEAFKCMRDNGYTGQVVRRGYQSFGAPDPGARASIDNLRAAGYPADHISLYLFPCYAQSASSSVERMLDHVGRSGWSGIVWMDIETNPSPGCGSRGGAATCIYIRQLIDAARAQGLRPGVYSSPGEWGNMGLGGCNIASTGAPLWYATYNSPSLPGSCTAQYSGFGGWGSPVAQQYWDSTGGLCGVNADKNRWCSNYAPLNSTRKD